MNAYLVYIGFIFSASSFYLGFSECCKPNADGQFTQLELGSASNVTAVVGSDVYFICCGGVKWTYEAEDDYTSREIGPHPYAQIGSSGKRPPMDKGLLTNSLGSNNIVSVSGISGSTTKDPMNSQNTIQTTVYTMHDDKGRLILRIDNVDMQDMGHYKCHGQLSSLDVYLVVTNKNYPEEPHNKTLPHSGSMLPHYMMFSSDQLNNVRLVCPLVGTQTVKSWLWREPVLPSSTEYAQLPQGRPPSRTVTATRPGLHEGKHVEIGPDLSWARIVDPLSPEAPVKLWCQFVMPSPWAGKDPIVAYYEIDWELYEPISPQIYILPEEKDTSTTTTSTNLEDGSNQNFPKHPVSQDHTYASIAHTINAQIEETIQRMKSSNNHRNNNYNNNNNKPILLENKPARIACRFRPITTTGKPATPQSHPIPIQQVYWYHNRNQPVHVPPFYVDNSLVNPYGLSILSVRAYPITFNMNYTNEDKSTASSSAAVASSYRSSDKYKLPVEHLTCSVISRVKETPEYKVISNASLEAEIILVPRIINTELLSAERSLEDAIKLTCTAIANGPPNMLIDFSASDQPSTNDNNHNNGRDGGGGGLTKWEPLKPRYGLNIRPRQVDPNNPTIHRLVIDISDLKRSDHGVYRCRVWNQAGEAEAIGNVLVHSEPQLDLVPFNGHNYFFGHKSWKASCLVKGYPLAVRAADTNGNRIHHQQMNRDESGGGINHSSTMVPGIQDGTGGVGGGGAGAGGRTPSDFINPPVGEEISSIKMKIFNVEGEPLDRVEVKQIDYKSGKFIGINATYEVQMNQRSGREAIVRCEYTHTDNRTIYREIFLHEATKPTAPNITVLCTGPRAIVFGITNPKLKTDNLPTERIVTQKVIFAPAKTFHLSSTLASLSVYLDSEGQPSASPANNNDPLDKTILTSISAQPQTAVIPVKGLIPDTEYVFEWSSGNEFGLSVMIQFTLWTKKLETAPTIKNVVFLSPTSQYLRFSTFLGDPCPYEGGARPELSDLLVRYRYARSNNTYDPTQLVGYGEWSDVEVCKNLASSSSSTAVNGGGGGDSENSYRVKSENIGTEEEEDEYTGIKWAGDNPIPCEIPVPDTQVTYEIEVATRNRFEKSEWFTTFYRPNAVVSAALFCYPKCSSILGCSHSPILTISSIVLCLFLKRL